LEDLGVDGRIILMDLRRNKVERRELGLSQYRDQWWTLVNRVMGHAHHMNVCGYHSGNLKQKFTEINLLL
jgi:hypothetical protein